MNGCFTVVIKPFHATGLFPYPLKTCGNLYSAYIFRGYRNKLAALEKPKNIVRAVRLLHCVIKRCYRAPVTHLLRLLSLFSIFLKFSNKCFPYKLVITTLEFFILNLNTKQYKKIDSQKKSFKDSKNFGKLSKSISLILHLT